MKFVAETILHVVRSDRQDEFVSYFCPGGDYSILRACNASGMCQCAGLIMYVCLRDTLCVCRVSKHVVCKSKPGLSNHAKVNSTQDSRTVSESNRSCQTHTASNAVSIECHIRITCTCGLFISYKCLCTCRQIGDGKFLIGQSPRSTKIRRRRYIL